MRRALIPALALPAVVAHGTPFGQDVTATLRGLVYDDEGEPLPGVPVTAASRSRGGSSRTALTDLKGKYKLPLPPPASDSYLVVSCPVFATTEVGPIDLDAGKTTLLDVHLQDSEDLTERIEVIGHGSVVDTTSTKTSTQSPVATTSRGRSGSSGGAGSWTATARRRITTPACRTTSSRATSGTSPPYSRWVAPCGGTGSGTSPPSRAWIASRG